MNLARCFRIPDTVIAQTIAGETVILDIDAGLYFGLDPIGARIWQLMAEGAPLNAVADQMMMEYEVSREQLERDVDDLITKLLENSLVVEIEDA